jgi:hypothetical protein
VAGERRGDQPAEVGLEVTPLDHPLVHRRPEVLGHEPAEPDHRADVDRRGAKALSRPQPLAEPALHRLAQPGLGDLIEADLIRLALAHDSQAGRHPDVGGVLGIEIDAPEVAELPVGVAEGGDGAVLAPACCSHFGEPVLERAVEKGLHPAGDE